MPCLWSSRTGLHTEVRLQLCLSRRPQRTRIARAQAYRGLADAGRARRLRGTNHHHRADRPTPTRLRGRYVEGSHDARRARLPSPVGAVDYRRTDDQPCPLGRVNRRGLPVLRETATLSTIHDWIHGGEPDRSGLRSLGRTSDPRRGSGDRSTGSSYFPRYSVLECHLDTLFPSIEAVRATFVKG